MQASFAAFGEELERPRVDPAVALVVDPFEPGIARRDLLGCCVEGNLCD